MNLQVGVSKLTCEKCKTQREEPWGGETAWLCFKCERVQDVDLEPRAAPWEEDGEEIGLDRLARRIADQNHNDFTTGKRRPSMKPSKKINPPKQTYTKAEEGEQLSKRLHLQWALAIWADDNVPEEDMTKLVGLATIDAVAANTSCLNGISLSTPRAIVGQMVRVFLGKLDPQGLLRLHHDVLWAAGSRGTPFDSDAGQHGQPQVPGTKLVALTPKEIAALKELAA